MDNHLKEFFDAQQISLNKRRRLLANILVWPLFILVIGWTAYCYFTATEDKEYYMIKENYNSQTGDYEKKELDTVKYEKAISDKKMRSLTSGAFLLFFPLMFGGVVFGMTFIMKKKFNELDWIQLVDRSLLNKRKDKEAEWMFELLGWRE